ncbi:MAG: DivIVA domain-containing protein [Deltaproteobacteria bacterium]|nr:DivIVA domain-containing protein [Deltaproteobacteria bacterium]
MKLTPLDIQQQQFRKVFRGCDHREVQSFLDVVSQQMGELVRENIELKSEARRFLHELEEHRDREATLREAMMTAQKAIEDIREQARKEAEVIIGEAEGRAEKIVHSAHARVTKVIEEINELKRQRVRAIEELRGVLQTHVRLLELHDHESHQETQQATVTVLDRVRAPTPPSLESLAQADLIG